MEIPIKDIGEQLKKDREELEKAGMVPKKDEEKYSPEEREEIKKLAYYIWEHRMAGEGEEARERQKKWAKEYGLNENAFSKETIEKLISDNVGEGKQWTTDAEKFMRDWDWATAEKVFKNKNLKKADKEPPTPGSGGKAVVSPDQKPMEDALKKQSAENERQIENKAIKEERLNERISEEEKRKMEFEAEQGDFSQAELNQAITDFEAKQAQIAEMRAQKAGRWASLRKTLGLKEKNFDEDPEIMGLEKEGHELYRSLMAKGINLYKGDKSQLENFLKQYDEFEVFKGTYNQELDKKAEVAGFPENILAGLHTLTKKWSELSWKQKLVIGAGGSLLFAGGAMALGAGTFGAATLTAGWRWGFRAFGAAAAGVGRNVMLDRQMMTEMENKAQERLQERMAMLEKYENNLDQGIEEMLGKSGIGGLRKDFENKRTENTLRATKFAFITFGTSVIVGETLREAGFSFGSMMRKIGEYTGLSSSGIKESAGHFLSGQNVSAESNPLIDHAANSPAAGAYPEGKSGLVGYGTEASGHDLVDSHPEGKYGPGLYGSEDEGHIPDTKPNFIEEARTSPAAGAYPEGKSGLVGYGTEASGHDLVDSHPEGKYSPGLYGSEAEGHDVVAAHPGGKYGPGLHGSEAEGHVNEFDQRYGPEKYGSEGEGHVTGEPGSGRAPDAEAKMAELGNRELGAHEVGKGGGIERSAKAIIKANPEAFGLHPDDPKLNTNAGKEAHKLARGLAEKYGMTYKELNEIASHKVQPGDEIRIFKDSATGKLSLDYKGSAFGDVVAPDNAPDISQGGSGEKIVPLQGGKIVPEEVHLKTGAAEHQPSRGGQMRVPNEILENERIAKEDFVKADQYQRDIRAFNAQEASRLEAVNEMANSRLYLSTRGLVNQLVNGAGVGDRANFFDKPMSSWEKLLGTGNYIAEDPQFTDQLNELNLNYNKLKNLYPILEKYHRQGIESIGDCLKEAVKDPKNVYMINRLVLRN